MIDLRTAAAARRRDRVRVGGADPPRASWSRRRGAPWASAPRSPPAISEELFYDLDAPVAPRRPPPRSRSPYAKQLEDAAVPQVAGDRGGRGPGDAPMGEFRMPSLGAGMDGGKVVEWCVAPGRRGRTAATSSRWSRPTRPPSRWRSSRTGSWRSCSSTRAPRSPSARRWPPCVPPGRRARHRASGRAEPAAEPSVAEPVPPRPAWPRSRRRPLSADRRRRRHHPPPPAARHLRRAPARAAVAHPRGPDPGARGGRLRGGASPYARRLAAERGAWTWPR